MGIFMPLRGGAPRPTIARVTAPPADEHAEHIEKLMLRHSLGRVGVSRHVPVGEGEGEHATHHVDRPSAP